MSRGWESKSVESQQSEVENISVQGPALSSAGTGNTTTDAERMRRRQSLELQRERILSERTASPHRRSALSAALADIEEKLAELGWTVHL